ncbi:MAG: SDR family NAD(P)-dependent oxidoreductase [Betaproteobacteria bacterium]
MDIPSLYSVTGKSVLITGGVGGIGRMLSEGFAAAGARVFITARKAEALEQTLSALRAAGAQAEGCVADLSSPAGLTSVIDWMKASVEQLDVLINNAGQTWGAPLETFPSKAWDPIMRVNVQAPFELAQGLLPLLEAAASDDNPARIINLGSVYGEITEVLTAYSYCASKAAIHHLTRVLARELAPKRILCNAIAPGLFPSKMTRFMLADAHKEPILAGIPLGRPGTPEDVVGLVLFLSARASAYITGAVIPIDGGIQIAH